MLKKDGPKLWKRSINLRSPKKKKSSKEVKWFSSKPAGKRHSWGLKPGLLHSKDVAVIFSLWLFWINKPQNQFEREKSWRPCERRKLLKLNWGCPRKWWLSYQKSKTSNIKKEVEQFIHQAHVLSYFNLLFLRTGTWLSEQFLAWLILFNLLKLF